MKRAHKDNERILSDIKHFKAMVANESAQLRKDITQHVSRSEGDSTEALIERVSEHLAKLNARMQIVETVLASELPVNRSVGDQLTNTIEVQGSRSQPAALPNLSKKVILNTQHFATNTNMDKAELTDTGLSYCWTKSNPITNFKALISREQPMQIKVRLVSLIKEDMKQDIKVLVDGNVVSSKIEFDGTLDCLVAEIPESKGKVDETKVAVQLPNTFSPQELGKSPDERKLGIAINIVEFNEPEKKKKRFFSFR
ncbi:hypothetical protein G3R49_05845 [Shewanella sp. WXL01]|uniref:Uncharacterized protein n=1 Tax=Shewanella maritima TaxID=2520507 RepID=A0A411PE93_9GAMM|nr:MULTISPECIES: hypothetical protein [Shewanella]NKF50091.1 hypothetical protein [Shewanella sp. WXL01]QBF81855.1 hypothetical protein EXU30_03440 [Shewanella maritima]